MKSRRLECVYPNGIHFSVKVVFPCFFTSWLLYRSSQFDYLPLPPIQIRCLSVSDSLERMCIICIMYNQYKMRQCKKFLENINFSQYQYVISSIFYFWWYFRRMAPTVMCIYDFAVRHRRVQPCTLRSAAQRNAPVIGRKTVIHVRTDVRRNRSMKNHGFRYRSFPRVHIGRRHGRTL